MSLMPIYRIVVFVPASHVDRVVGGVCAIDDLRIGNYGHAAWIAAPGIEQFRPLDGADPAHGTVGELARVESVRVEFCIPRDEARLQRVIDDGIRANHPWECPAIIVDEAMLPSDGGTRRPLGTG